MNELIAINYEKDEPCVSGRDLHKRLEIGTEYMKWFERMCEYGFINGKDYSSFLTNRSDGLPGKSKTDHLVKFDMAKEICMIQRSEIGKQCREYFIEAEKRYREQNIIPSLNSKFLYQIAQTLEEKERTIAELAPKAEFFDAVTDSKDTMDMGEAAKVLNMGIGRNNLFKFLKYKGVLMSDKQPYQKYIDSGYFRTILQPYRKPNGELCNRVKTLVYPKGLDFIRRLYADTQGGVSKANIRKG